MSKMFGSEASCGKSLMHGVSCAGVQCHMPANGESVTISTVPTVPVDVSLSLLKRTMSATGEPTGHCYPLSEICMNYYSSFWMFVLGNWLILLHDC